MTTGHENGGWMNEDQRASHPDPFVFLTTDTRLPRKAMRWGGEWWLFYWHEGQNSWVSLRPVSGDELRVLRPLAMRPEHAKLYDDLHDKFASRSATGSATAPEPTSQCFADPCGCDEPPVAS